MSKEIHTIGFLKLSRRDGFILWRVENNWSFWFKFPAHIDQFSILLSELNVMMLLMERIMACSVYQTISVELDCLLGSIVIPAFE